jgi:hypothetical protein
MSDSSEPVWIVHNAEITLVNGNTIKLGQVNVYPSGLLIDPRTRTTISPAGYVAVQPA